MNYDNFELVKRLGSGSFGIVYLALKKDTKEQVALKVYRENVNTDPIEDCLELSLELQHPNLMSCSYFFYDRIFTDKGKREEKFTLHLFSVLEYIPGKSLYKLVRQNVEKLYEFNELRGDELSELNEQRNIISLESNMDIYLPQIISALQYLHDLGIVHCDIKHENIIIYENKVKIIDYDFLTRDVENSRKGTPYFLSPEIYTGKNISEKIDIWSLGITIYYYIMCEYPFDADNKEELKKIVLSSFTPDYSRFSNKYRQIISGMLRRNPLARFTLEEIKELLIT